MPQSEYPEGFAEGRPEPWPGAFGDGYRDSFVDGYGEYGAPPPGMMWQGQLMPGQPPPDLRPPMSRYIIAVAIGILVAAVTVSIVLAVTGG
jgi:hypothetical protein